MKPDIELLMGFEVKTSDEPPEQLDEICTDPEDGIIILPVYSGLQDNPSEPIDAAEAANIEKLWEQNQVPYRRVEGSGTRVQFSDATILAPLYTTLDFLAENPDVIVLGFEALCIYYERRSSEEVELEVTVDSEDQTTSIEYSGPVEGLKEVPETVFEALDIHPNLEEEELVEEEND